MPEDTAPYSQNTHTGQSTRPSKQFIKRGAIAFGIVVIILVVQTTWFKKLFKKDKTTSVTAVTVGDIVTRDTNGNGIADWEEKLWGLDPTVLYTDGVSNKTIIEEKKKSLGVVDVPEADLNETDRIARELFALTTALGQSDDIDNDTLSAIASQLGTSIDIKQVTNHYSLQNIKTVNTTTQSLRTYYASMNKEISKYNTDTADIDVVIAALQTGDTSRIPELAQSAVLYNTIAKEMGTIPVPIGVANYHLAIMNSFSGIADSFSYLNQIDDNSVVSLVGVAIYKGYANKLGTALANMDDYLTRYGIL